MTEQPLNEKQIAAIRRMSDHLPKGNDLILLVLKGHLLMEERLFVMLEDSTRYPEFVAKAGLRTALSSESMVTSVKCGIGANSSNTA